MRLNFGTKPWTFPQAVFIIGTYDENGVPDAMNAAWGSIGDDEEIFMCISEGHKTTKNILLKKEFTVSFGTADTVEACDFVGLISANYEHNQDKIERSGLTPVKSQFVDAPEFEQLPVVAACRLVSYDEKTGHLFGQIINISIDKNVLDSQGKPDVDKMKLISFDPVNCSYRVLGEQIGKAFEIGKKLR